ncbi:MAG: ABC transporter ATP-binding protein [Pelolinea sp.]|nr:ABC transporter ATP-binding protein [Pelolinea sp.]
MKSINTKLDLQSISYSYEIDDHFRINDLSIEIPENSITTIIGKNGSGKTTLLLLMMGYLKPSSGIIRFRDNEKYLPIEQTAGKIAFLPQNEIVSFKFTVNDFLLLGRIPFIGNISQPTIEDYLKVEEIKKELDIVQLGKKKLEQISGGELQRVRIGRALVQEADMLIFDEPITHLDIGAKLKIFHLMNKLKEQGKTILFSSHDPLEAFQIADNSILIERNKEIIFGSTNEVLDDDNLSSCLGTSIKYGSFEGQKFLILEK